MTAIHGWGRYPVVDAAVAAPATRSAAVQAILEGAGQVSIARGLGRSYGDSSLAARVISSARLDCLLGFDAATGRVRCEAGVSLASLLAEFAPRGWFLPVTPGTKFVTVGGAIASDVHGKNHHIDGCFSEFVDEFQLAVADGRVLRCARDENPELFHATCGGMGLTGVILEATIRLMAVQSGYIDQTTFKAANLEAALALFEANHSATYSVAWIDCLATGVRLGRSLLMTGEHCRDGQLATVPVRSRSVPVDMPAWLLNRHSNSLFNALIYARALRQRTQARVHYEPYFYPLDGLLDWNRLYGKAGFTQYQFVIPRAAGLRGLTEIVERIARSGRGSFVAVLKSTGGENLNYCSFPLEGYSLAIDFKLDNSLFAFLEELDAAVLDHGGRIYLAKDVRVSAASFKRSYPRWERLQAVRAQVGAIGRFASLQSRRIGLED